MISKHKIGNIYSIGMRESYYMLVEIKELVYFVKICGTNSTGTSLPVGFIWNKTRGVKVIDKNNITKEEFYKIRIILNFLKYEGTNFKDVMKSNIIERL